VTASCQAWLEKWVWNVLTASTQYLHACKTRDGSESTITRECRLFVSNEHYVYMCNMYIHFMRYWFFIRSVGFSFLWSWNRIVSYNVSYDVQQLAMLTRGVESFIVSIARLIRSSCRFQKKYSRSSGTSEDLQELLHDRDRHVDGEIKGKLYALGYKEWVVFS
jgi:hypothetical protein